MLRSFSSCGRRIRRKASTMRGCSGDRAWERGLNDLGGGGTEEQKTESLKRKASVREQRNEDEEKVTFRDGSELRVLEGGGLQDRKIRT